MSSDSEINTNGIQNLVTIHFASNVPFFCHTVLIDLFHKNMAADLLFFYDVYVF